MPNPVEFYSIYQGDDRTLPLRVQNPVPDCTPYSLVGVTDIQVKFKKFDGQAITKTLVADFPLAGGIQILDASAGRFSVELTEDESALLHVGERQDFTAYIYKGLISTSTYAGVVFKANNPGASGNLITLVFDGIKTVSQVISVWNLANYNNQVHFMAPETGTSVLAAGTTVLAGGTNNRRIVNYKRAISVFKPSV